MGGVKGMVVKGRKSKLGLPHPGELQKTRVPLRYAFSSAAAVSKGPCGAATQLYEYSALECSRSCTTEVKRCTSIVVSCYSKEWLVFMCAPGCSTQSC